MSAAPLPNEIAPQVLPLVDDMTRLCALLEQEFDALKAQQLDRFEALQRDKETALHTVDQRFRDLSPQPGQVADFFAYPQVRGLAQRCRELQTRNEMLIQRKLQVVRSALHTLHTFAGSPPVETYDRKGRLRSELPRLALARR